MIRASQEGRVTAATSSGDYGNWIEVAHGGGITTRYAHNFENYVGVGDHVLKGQMIGAVGQTGNARGQLSTEAHVHFEVRLNGRAVNPELYLNLPCSWSLRQASVGGNWPVILPQ
jgi:murein DD-endopeptidase MepM/ murein hydrolase activator NlpD